MFVLGAMTYRMHRKNAELTRELTLSEMPQSMTWKVQKGGSENHPCLGGNGR